MHFSLVLALRDQRRPTTTTVSGGARSPPSAVLGLRTASVSAPARPRAGTAHPIRHRRGGRACPARGRAACACRSRRPRGKPARPAGEATEAGDDAASRTVHAGTR